MLSPIADPLIQEFAHRTVGVQLWGGMKYDAQQSVEDPQNGAAYVAEMLGNFIKAHPTVEVHAAGHSAGSIFHSYFVPAAVAHNVPFKSMHFLAPAIRVDEYKKRLERLIGTHVGHLTLYTMRRELEEGDNCAKAYQKSLLYLIYFALEPERRTPLLGLQQSLLNDPALVQTFGLGATAGQHAEVVWSRSDVDLRPSSHATSHGGFEDDAATCHCVKARYDTPVSPTLPLHHGCAAAHSMAS